MGKYCSQCEFFWRKKSKNLSKTKTTIWICYTKFEILECAVKMCKREGNLFTCARTATIIFIHLNVSNVPWTFYVEHSISYKIFNTELRSSLLQIYFWVPCGLFRICFHWFKTLNAPNCCSIFIVLKCSTSKKQNLIITRV